MKRRESGQAAVEAALTLPLMVFLFLGTLQLFLCYQARLLAVYAASRAAAAGARSHAQCLPMQHAAAAALVPSVASFAQGNPGADAARYGDLFREMTQGGAGPQFSRAGPHNGRAMFWMIRRFGGGIGGAGGEEENFDLPNGSDRTLEVRMVYWYPMKIPFANWVISAMFRAHYGIQSYTHQNPLLMTQKAQWNGTPGSSLPGAMSGELQARAAAGAYACPVVTGWATRLMTPLRDGRTACPGAPGGVTIP